MGMIYCMKCRNIVQKQGAAFHSEQKIARAYYYGHSLEIININDSLSNTC